MYFFQFILRTGNSTVSNIQTGGYNHHTLATINKQMKPARQNQKLFKREHLQQAKDGLEGRRSYFTAPRNLL